MRPSNFKALIVAIVFGSAYGGWLSYEQWSSAPHGNWFQGLTQFGWPTDFLRAYSSVGSPNVEWKWSVTNLCINTGFAVALSLAVFGLAFQTITAIQQRGRGTFSLGALFGVTTAVAAAFSLWKIVPVISMAGAQRWDFLVTDGKISLTLQVMVSLGLFSVAWCTLRVLAGAVHAITCQVSSLVRRFCGSPRGCMLKGASNSRDLAIREAGASP